MTDPNAPSVQGHTASEIVVLLLPGVVNEWDAVGAKSALRAPIGTGFPQFGVLPVFDEARIPRLIARARRVTPNYAPPEFGSYYFVKFPGDPPLDDVDDVLKRLRGSSGSAVVQWAEHHFIPSGPGVLPFKNEHWVHCGHLDGEELLYTPHDYALSPYAVRGTGAWYAWRFQGGDGRGVTFIDIERSWKLDHEDLQRHSIPDPIIGVAGTGLNTTRHGTNALGTVCARDNRKGIVGVVPRVSTVLVASYKRDPRLDPVDIRIADTIMAAIDHYPPEGGVMLLEVEYTPPGETVPRPVEYSQDVFVAIDLAVNAGIVVIEPAGNGASDIDAWTGHWASSQPLGSEVRDSGAIIVGAAMEKIQTVRTISGVSVTVDHERYAESNFGARVDCWAWGNRVTTTSVNSTMDDMYEAWGATSAASAVIAGICVALRGAHLYEYGTELSPGDLRQYLRTRGWASTKPWEHPDPLTLVADGQIGRQPDVRTIIDEDLELPFPWVRDWLDDVGEPDVASHMASPDMVIRTQGAALGGATLGDDALAIGDDAQVQIRVHNRGLRDASDVRLVVFWATPGIASGDWQFLDDATVANVPAGGHDDVKIDWDSVPAEPWNIALMSILRVDRSDRRYRRHKPPRTKRARWYQRMRSIATRLEMTASYAPTPDSIVGVDTMDLEFEVDVSGVRDDAEMEIATRMPSSARLFLEVPASAGSRLRVRIPSARSRADRSIVFELSAGGRHRLPLRWFRSDSPVKLRLLVHIYAFDDNRDVHVAVRQFDCDVPSLGARWRIRPPAPVT